MPRAALLVVCVVVGLFPSLGRAGKWTGAAKSAMARAGNNRSEIMAAIQGVPVDERDAMEFLVAFMPARDLVSLKSEFLLENHRLAHQAWTSAAWKDDIPEDVFLNYLLPYANINERRDAWRSDFRKQFLPLVAEAKTPSEAAVLLNEKIFPMLNVRYSTKRQRADQAPLESIKSGLASCTGLSILLIDACRSVGVPARFVGTPLWSDKSGNHSWVEIWDGGWHFTGAAEPTDGAIDHAWFVGRASKSQRDHRLHAIYAVRYQTTPQTFPLVWDPSIQYVFATNVTERYLRPPPTPVPKDHVELMIRVFDRGERVAAKLEIMNEEGEVIFEGTTKDERFDRNDHLTVVVPDELLTFKVVGPSPRQTIQQAFTPKPGEILTIGLPRQKPDAETPTGKAGAKPEEPTADNVGPIAALKKSLADPKILLSDLPKSLVGELDKPLTKAEAEQAKALLWDRHVKEIRKTRAAEMEAKQIQVGDLTMPFFIKVFGDKPKGGRSLYISMHGGGGAPSRVNDQQWQNQKRLYQLDEGVYLAPRAPTNTWNLWHQGHIDGMFRRLIENLIVFEDVNPDRVYIMGYSAGGDGVFQLAPRMADSLAAAAMMAGHPNETSPLGLRNLPFTLHMGGRDAAYKRNEIAKQWEEKLADLRKKDPHGYEHWVKIYPNKGHWMDREDAAAVPWMAKFNRQRQPNRIVWKQDDVTHSRFYWLAVDDDQKIARAEVRAEREGQTFQVNMGELKQIRIRLDDEMVDMKQQVVVKSGDQVLLAALPQRTLKTIVTTLRERGDPSDVYTAELVVQAPDQ